MALLPLQLMLYLFLETGCPFLHLCLDSKHLHTTELTYLNVSSNPTFQNICFRLPRTKFSHEYSKKLTSFKTAETTTPQNYDRCLDRCER